MNKTNKLTTRDKKLLALFFVIIIIVGYFNFLLFPLINKQNELNSSLRNAKSQKQSISSVIDSASDKKIAYEKSLKALNEEKSSLEYMNNEQIDILISELCQQCSLKQTDLSLSTKDYLKLTDKEKIIVTQIKLQLTGDSSGIFSFIDAVDKIRNLFVDNFTIADLSSNQNYSIVLNLYMLNENRGAYEK